ncbi:MAG: 3-dehydroquinate synthase [Acidobacteriota bacterium]
MKHTSSTKSPRGIYLVGFSGSGKSTISKLIAKKLQWRACDLDELIVERAGLDIPTLFSREGEPGFRLRESEALHAASSHGPFVIATGGGTVVRSENRNLMARKGWIIFLEAQAEVLHARIQRQLENCDTKAIRPLLDAVYPLDQIRSLKHTRQPVYSLADWTIHTDRLTADQVADEVIRAVHLLEHSREPAVLQDMVGVPRRHSLNTDLPPPIVVAAGAWPYQVIVGWNNLSSLGQQVKRVLPHTHRAAILTDASTWQQVGSTVEQSLGTEGVEVHVRKIAAQESIKTLAEVNAIYEWLLEIHFHRDDALVVIGGGAIDDVGGFAASTYMRGVPLVKIPTSLEGMVDTSIGGKTALNHPRARNLIGTFYHPRLVWTDASLLFDEPKEQQRAAWAEVVKYAMLENSLLREEPVGSSLFSLVTENLGKLAALEKGTLLNIIARCVALKAQVVASDERDFGNIRILLNYGHTIGHALETVMKYTLPHGSAVSIGMAIEARISVRLGLAGSDVATRQNELLTRLGLPTRLPEVPVDLLLAHINNDKKVLADAPRWILPTTIGRATVSSSVTQTDLLSVIRQSLHHD